MTAIPTRRPIPLRVSIDARTTFEYLTSCGLSVEATAALMHRAWLRGKSRRGKLVLTVPSVNSDGPEEAKYTITLE